MFVPLYLSIRHPLHGFTENCLLHRSISGDFISLVATIVIGIAKISISTVLTTDFDFMCKVKGDLMACAMSDLSRNLVMLLVDALRSVSYKDDSNWTCILLNFNQAFSLLELNVMLELI